MEKETITIHITTTGLGDGYKDHCVFQGEMHRDEASKAIREFAELLESQFYS